MAVPVDRTAERFDDIEANVAIVCNWTLYDINEVYVYFSDSRTEAVRNVDYTVTLNPGVDYTSFTITPKTSLLAKIGSDPNYIEVRRILDLENDTTPATARNSSVVSRHLDKLTLMLQQLAEPMTRMFRLPFGLSDVYDMELPEHEANKALTWHATEKRLVNSVQNVNESPTAQAVEAAAAAEAAAAEAVPAAATAVAAANAAAAIAGSGTGLPVGGVAGDVLTKTGPLTTDREWVAPDDSIIAPAFAGATEDAAPADNDYAGGITNAGLLRKWSWVNIRNWMALHLAPTGQMSHFLRSTAPSGWVEGGGTIGSAASGATTRANADTAALFALAWALDPLDSAIYTSAGAPSARGADAATDFAANKRIALPDGRGEWVRGWDNGRSINTGRRLGSYEAEMIGPHPHNLNMDPMAAHAHTLTAHGQSRRGANGTNTGTNFYGSSGDSTSGGTASKATNNISAGTPTGTAANNSGTENRVRGLAGLFCYKL